MTKHPAIAALAAWLGSAITFSLQQTLGLVCAIGSLAATVFAILAAIEKRRVSKLERIIRAKELCLACRSNGRPVACPLPAALRPQTCPHDLVK